MRFLVRPYQAVGLLAGLTIAAVLLTTGLLLWSLRAQELKHAQLETASLAEMLLE